MWKTLDGRIVPAVAVAADGRSDPPSRQCRATGLNGLLDPAVGVENQSGRGSLAFDGHVASVQGDLGMQGLAHGPADDPAGVHAEDGGEAGPAFTGRDAGQVGKPGLTGSRSFEVAGPPVGSACWARSDSRGGCWSSGPDAAGRPALASRRGASGGLEPVFRSPGASEFSYFARTRNGRLTGTPPPPKSPPPPDTGAKQCLRRVRWIGL